MEKEDIPQKNSNVDTILQKYYNQASVSAELKKLIDKKLDTVEEDIQLKIINAYTISDYFNTLWNHSDIRMNMRDDAISKVEAVLKLKKFEIMRGDLEVEEEGPSAEDLIAKKQKASKFEEFNASEKMKDIQDRKWELEHRLHSIDADLNIMKSINRPFYSNKSIHTRSVDFMHYSQAMYDDRGDDRYIHEEAKTFVSKMNEEKFQLRSRLKNIESSLEQRDIEEAKLVIQKQREKEERQIEEKRKRIQDQIARNEQHRQWRQDDQKEWNKRLDDIKKHKQFMRKLEQVGRKNQNKLLEEKMREREEYKRRIKELNKPLDRRQLLQWQKETDQKMKEFHDKMGMNLSSVKNSNFKPKNLYHAKIHKDVVSDLQHQRHSKENEFNVRKEKQKRQLEKAKEIHERNLERYGGNEDTDGVKNHIFQSSMKPVDREQLLKDKKKEANEYLNQLRKKREENPRPKKNLSEKLLVSDKRNSLSQKSDLLNDMSTTNGKAAPIKKNYMREIKSKGLLKHDPDNKIESIIEDRTLSKRDREDLLRAETEKIEMKLKYIEQQRKYKEKLNDKEIERFEVGKSVDEDDGLELESMYINSIKAKLELLGDK